MWQTEVNLQKSSDFYLPIWETTNKEDKSPRLLNSLKENPKFAFHAEEFRGKIRHIFGWHAKKNIYIIITPFNCKQNSFGRFPLISKKKLLLN